MTFLLRQLATAALTANALHPPKSYRAGIRAGVAAFAAGMLTDELAPQLLGLTALDTAVAAKRGRTSPVSLALAAGSSLGLMHMIAQSQRSKDVLEEALVEGLGGVEYVEELDAVPTPAELATPWRQVARPLHFGDPAVRVERNIAYTDYGRRGYLDLYVPEVADLSNAPVLLQVHGGAWTVGRKDTQAQPLLYRMAAKGWICVAINYRLAPRDPFPAQIVDVKSAIAWIKEHIAAYGGDPDYLAITGGSAGGHLASLAALTPGDPAFQPGFEDADTSIQAAVPFYGVYDFAGVTGLSTAEMMRDLFLSKKVLMQPFAENPAAFEAASPIMRITDETPDFFVLHGTNDTLVDIEQAQAFVQRLRSVSTKRVAYAELPGAQHAFDVLNSIRSAHAVRAVDRFLSWSWNRHRRTHAA